jgi:hypothetical protein
MALTLVLSAPLIVFAVARWAWRFHLRALRTLGPALVARAGVPAPASTTEVVSVLVEDDAVMVGLRPAGEGLPQVPGAAFRACVSTLVLSLEGHGRGPVARLQRWRASGAPLLVWWDAAEDSVEFCQLQTGQRVRLARVSGSVRVENGDDGCGGVDRQVQGSEIGVRGRPVGLADSEGVRRGGGDADHRRRP